MAPVIGRQTIEKPEPDWKWWVGITDERFGDGPFETREEAITFGRGDYPEGFYLVRATQFGNAGEMKLSELIEIKDILVEQEENGQFAEMQDPDGDPFLDFTSTQLDDLDKMVRAVFDEWQAKHNVKIRACLFKDFDRPTFIGPEEEKSP